MWAHAKHTPSAPDTIINKVKKPIDTNHAEGFEGNVYYLKARSYKWTDDGVREKFG